MGGDRGGFPPFFFGAFSGVLVRLSFAKSLDRPPQKVEGIV